MAARRTALTRARKAVNHTQESLAELLGVDRTTVFRWEQGTSEPLPVMWPRLATALKLAEAELVAILSRYDTHEIVSALPWLAPVPEDDDELEALELVRRVGATDVSSGTLARLESAVDDLAIAYPRTPPQELIQRVRRHIGYVNRLLDGRMTLAQHRRLLVVGAWLSLLGATVHVDLNQQVSATARLKTAASLAEDAEHDEIRAWCLETEAWRLLTEGNFKEALRLSLSAQQLAPVGSSIAIQAAAQEGRALARLGQRKETYDALSRVHRLVEPLVMPENPEHHYRYDPSKSVAYTATTLAWVGDSAAERYAREIISRLGGGGDPGKWPRRVASANLDLALALLVTDELDEACAATLQAISSGRVVPSNQWRAAEVVKAVEARQVPEAAELREAYEAMRRV
ncbi:hypothetical protein GCM10010174_24440 [Kutzneria viridogrisea]|uniref:helix-turn-helix transcriptional regulator n=1 Tax=Kutzneria viridogrisea TaxID=47990 RepID=UPI0031F85779